uniref:Uncharacterized protein n=1 Tax=Ditylenchus dipsaci TaxID=166011 RepID=A0A915D753_9BILA
MPASLGSFTQVSDLATFYIKNQIITGNLRDFEREFETWANICATSDLTNQDVSVAFWSAINIRCSLPVHSNKTAQRMLGITQGTIGPIILRKEGPEDLNAQSVQNRQKIRTLFEEQALRRSSSSRISLYCVL